MPQSRKRVGRGTKKNKRREGRGPRDSAGPPSTTAVGFFFLLAFASSFLPRSRTASLFFSRPSFFLPLSLSLSFPPCFQAPNFVRRSLREQKKERRRNRATGFRSPFSYSCSLSLWGKKNQKNSRRTRTRSSSPGTARARPSAGRTQPRRLPEETQLRCLLLRGARSRGARAQRPAPAKGTTRGCGAGRASRGRRRTIPSATGSPTESLPFRGSGWRA